MCSMCSPTHEIGNGEGGESGESNLLRVGEDVELPHHPVPVGEKVEGGSGQVGQRQAEEADVDPLAEPLPEEHGHVESVAHLLLSLIMIMRRLAGFTGFTGR